MRLVCGRQCLAREPSEQHTGRAMPSGPIGHSAGIPLGLGLVQIDGRPIQSNQRAPHRLEAVFRSGQGEPLPPRPFGAHWAPSRPKYEGPAPAGRPIFHRLLRAHFPSLSSWPDDWGWPSAGPKLHTTARSPWGAR